MTILPFSVFYNNNSLVNILSFSAVTRRFSITIGIDLDSLIKCTSTMEPASSSKTSGGGLYYYDTTNMENNTTNNQVANYTFLNTVDSNKSYFQRL